MSMGTFEFAEKIRVNTTMLDKIVLEEKHDKLYLRRNMINQNNDLFPEHLYNNYFVF